MHACIHFLHYLIKYVFLRHFMYICEFLHVKVCCVICTLCVCVLCVGEHTHVCVHILVRR